VTVPISRVSSYFQFLLFLLSFQTAIKSNQSIRTLAAILLVNINRIQGGKKINLKRQETTWKICCSGVLCDTLSSFRDGKDGLGLTLNVRSMTCARTSKEKIPGLQESFSHSVFGSHFSSRHSKWNGLSLQDRNVGGSYSSRWLRQQRDEAQRWPCRKKEWEK